MEKEKKKPPEEKEPTLYLNTGDQPLRLTVSHESRVPVGPGRPDETFWTRLEVPLVLESGEAMTELEEMTPAIINASKTLSRWVLLAISQHQALFTTVFGERDEENGHHLNGEVVILPDEENPDY